QPCAAAPALHRQTPARVSLQSRSGKDEQSSAVAPDRQNDTSPRPQTKEQKTKRNSEGMPDLMVEHMLPLLRWSKFGNITTRLGAARFAAGSTSSTPTPPAR